eukprot:8950867-Heterocapsa_arctica.AAC.1
MENVLHSKAQLQSSRPLAAAVHSATSSLRQAEPTTAGGTRPHELSPAKASARPQRAARAVHENSAVMS